MAILIYILVIISALFLIASGVWVAVTLVKVVAPKGVSKTTKKITSKQKSGC
jgi:hypothetical protein